MSFNKFTTFKVEKDDVEVLDGNLIKTAAMKLPDGFTYDPDYLYLKVKAVSAGEYWGSNKNDDYFPEIELIGGHKTFLTAHTFKNHENKKIENAIGDVLTSEWSDKMKCVYLVIRIDKRVAPTITRGYEKGFMTDVSMGCRVDHVVCSYCGQKAKTRFDYCDHLKSMKGKIMDNGKKVYEINIGPKFHDISAVLNGAERTAKVEGLYIHGDKVAFEKGDSLEKVARFNGSMFESEMFDKCIARNSEEFDMEVVASSLKKDEPKKLNTSDAKETIKNKAFQKALSEVSENRLKEFESISDIIKLAYTKYWDKSKCSSIGIALRDLAKQNRVSSQTMFAQFLKVLDFAAIELSPLEIHDIFFEAMNMECHDLRGIKSKLSRQDLVNNERICGNLSTNCSMEQTIKTVGALSQMCQRDGYSMLSDRPAAKIKAVIIKSNKSPLVDNNDFTDTLMSNIVSGLLPDRSNHRQFLMPRLEGIADGSIQSRNNSCHFAPIKMVKMTNVDNGLHDTVIPAILSAVINSAYQDSRVKRLNSGELEDGIKKIAGYLDDNIIEKTAKIKVSPTKAVMIGAPLTMSYSALQRSRMNNGERISSMNRYIADNPTNAALLSAFLIGNGAKHFNKAVPAAKKGVKGVAEYIAKNASEEYNIFKDTEIDDMMNQKGYSSNDITTIKYASVLTSIGNEDLAENMLIDKSLNYSDIDEYLKTATSCFKIELEKNASSVIKTIGKSVLGDVVLNNSKKRSVAASLPGYIADGLIFTAIGKGLNNAANKVTKGEMING